MLNESKQNEEVNDEIYAFIANTINNDHIFCMLSKKDRVQLAETNYFKFIKTINHSSNDIDVMDKAKHFMNELTKIDKNKSNNRIIWIVFAVLAIFGLLLSGYVINGQAKRSILSHQFCQQSVLPRSKVIQQWETKGKTYKVVRHHDGKKEIRRSKNAGWFSMEKVLVKYHDAAFHVVSDDYAPELQSCFFTGTKRGCTITIFNAPKGRVLMYTLVEELGKGGYGTVWKANNVNGEKGDAQVEVAVKFVKDVHVPGWKDVEEKLTQAMGKHKHSVPYIGSYKSRDEKAIILGLCEKNGHVDELDKAQIKKIMLSVTKASQKLYKHDIGYIHRDIKLDNIFGKTNGTGKDWVLGDYGSAISIDDAKQLLKCGEITYSFAGTSRSPLDIYVMYKRMVGNECAGDIMADALEMDIIFDIINVAIASLRKKSQVWQVLYKFFVYFAGDVGQKEHECMANLGRFNALVVELTGIIELDVTKFDEGSEEPLSLGELIIYVLFVSVGQVEEPSLVEFIPLKLDEFLKLIERVDVDVNLIGA